MFNALANVLTSLFLIVIFTLVHREISTHCILYMAVMNGPFEKLTTPPHGFFLFLMRRNKCDPLSVMVWI